ncbi:MAG: class C sortase [Bacilli bacterium]|nr:class C sortase [Bacilli bacterium]
MKGKGSKLKKQIPNIILALVFIIGLGIFLYPSISNFLNTWLQNRELSNYTHEVSELSTEKYDKLINDAKEYNANLVGNNLRRNAENIKNTDYPNLLSLDKKGIIGYLSIEKIDVKLPIYHGTSNSALQVGIGHLEGSSLPVEGESVHCVVSGHTGLPSAKLLTDLVELKVGDTFRINVLNERYTYIVDQILVVEPNETDALEIVEGKQYATILTCTPYGVNSHRLLVRGELVNNVIESDVVADATIVDSSTITIILSAILMIILFIVMINIRKRKENKERNNDNNEEEDISK